ncbi:hydroxyisourate hydrolase [Sphingomonas sp. BLCC-B65]|nr:hydroxyisourate hydrolase [Sphingomonas sp. BLCC-B65]
MTHLTTHVLDGAAGAPASGVDVKLLDADGVAVASGRTDADGRLALGPDELPRGTYALVFATAPYFAARGTETFYPSVTVAFTVADTRHYHVPLLLSPFAYSTYRGT